MRTTKEKAREIVNNYLKNSSVFFADAVDEEMAIDLVEIGLIEGEKKQRR